MCDGTIIVLKLTSSVQCAIDFKPSKSDVPNSKFTIYMKILVRIC